MRGRGYWIFQFILCLLVVIIFWAAYFLGHVPLQIAVLSLLSFLCLAVSYGLRRFAGDRIFLWRCLFILSGMGIGFVLWGISVIILRRVFGLSADLSAFIALPWYLLGGYLGDRLGKRRNYMP